jgi:hypothetical protein
MTYVLTYACQLITCNTALVQKPSLSPIEAMHQHHNRAEWEFKKA